MPTADKPRERSGGRIRRLTDEELRLWRLAIADVTPLLPPPDGAGAAGDAPAAAKGVAAEPPPPPASDARKDALKPAPVARRPAMRRPSMAREELAPGIAPGLDKRFLARLQRGLLAPETQVDLHHCTQEEAHRVLTGFIASSQAAGRRCVLVITGKGYGSGATVGVLKTMVPRWLNEQPNRGRILAFCHAVASHGGEGALYVLLKRLRPR